MDPLDGTTDGMQAGAQMAAAVPPQTDPLAGAPATPAAPAAAAPPAAPATPGAAPAAGAPAAAPAAAPATPAAPPKPQGIAGVMDSVLDMLQSRDRSGVTYDQNGNKVAVPGQPMTRGQQIADIALTALKGATTAAAAKPGIGHTYAGLSDAVQQSIGDQQAAAHAKDENAQHDFAVKQKAKMDNLNYQLLTRQNTAAQFELQAKQVKATEDGVAFAGKLEDREKELGSYDLGTFKDEHDLPNIMAKQPALFQKLYKEQGIITVPVYGADGSRQGVHVFERKPDVNAQLAPQGAVAHKWVLGDKPGDAPTMQTFTPSGATNGDIDRYNLKALSDQQAWEKSQADIGEKNAQASEANANAKAKPAETQAKMIEATSGAAKNYAEAAKARQEAATASVDNPANDDDSLVRGMVNNTVDIRSIASLRQNRREQLVRKAMEMDPGFNEKKYEAAMDTVKDFSEPQGKGYQAIQSLNKFMGHADGLLTATADLRNSNSPLINKPLNAIKTGVLGRTPVTDFRQYLDAAGNEHMNYMLAGRAPHSEDVKARDEGLNENMTPAQIEGAVKSDMRIQLTQLGAMNRRHMDTVGQPAYGMIDPSTKAIIDKAGLTDYARKELGAAYDGVPGQQPQQQAQQQPAAIPANHPQQAQAAGVPAGAQAGYSNGKLVGYQDAQGWHPLNGGR